MKKIIAGMLLLGCAITTYATGTGSDIKIASLSQSDVFKLITVSDRLAQFGEEAAETISKGASRL
jgi:hypothetical protein